MSAVRTTYEPRPESTAPIGRLGDAQRADDRAEPQGERPRAEVVAPFCAPPVAMSATPDASNRPEPIEALGTTDGALRGRNVALWMTGELAVEATDGTVIVFDASTALRVADWFAKVGVRS